MACPAGRAAVALEPSVASESNMLQLSGIWKRSGEISRLSECTTGANHGPTQHAFSCVLSEQTVLLQAPKESCTLMDRCSCAHARKRPCEASSGLATITGAKGSALTVGHLTARSQAPQSPCQLGCRRAAGSLYPRGACGTAASRPAASKPRKPQAPRAPVLQIILGKFRLPSERAPLGPVPANDRAISTARATSRIG